MAVLKRRQQAKTSKAWTTAIWHDYTAISRRPLNRRMVVESAMGMEGAGLSEMGGGGGNAGH